MPLFLIGLYFIGGTVVISLLGMWAVRKIVPRELLDQHKEIAGFIYAVIGAIYGVILGFSVVVLWEQFHEAEDRADATGTDERPESGD